MAIVLLICLSMWLTPQLSSCVSPPYSDTAGVPLKFYVAVNDSLTEINLMLDDTQKSIHDQQGVSIPVLVEMNQSIGDGGPFDSHLAVSPKVFTRFVVFIDNIATQVAIQMTQLFLDGINKVADLLKPLSKPDRAARTVKLLKFVIFEIAPKIGKVTAENKARYWDIYEWCAVRLVHLQTHGSPTPEAYENRLNYVLNYGVVNINRYINEVGNLVNQFASEVADKLYALIRESLNPAIAVVGSTVEPWVEDDNLDL